MASCWRLSPELPVHLERWRSLVCTASRFRSGPDLGGDQAVEADLVAGWTSPRRDRPHMEDHGRARPAVKFVRLQRHQGGDVRQQAAERDVLPERDKLPF